jgi:hypothetical protein
MIIEEYNEIITVFYEKVLEKIKDEHNFIEIYVKIMKKLCKKMIKLPSNDSN